MAPNVPAMSSPKRSLGGATTSARKRGRSQASTSGSFGAEAEAETYDGGYGVGSIRRVVVHNFMTYTDCWFEPGPRLNLLLGPNGSGKSTIVCALCIGLAASPKLLGRADNVKDFVKRGEASGWVEITLQTKPRPNASPFLHDGSSGDNEEGRKRKLKNVVKIRRTLLKDTNSSSWQLNGRNAGFREIQDLVKKLNVQIDNLCQFLPQDKVVSFAKLSPEALLKETEKAISMSGDKENSLFEIHEKLEGYHSEGTTLKQMIQTHQQKLEWLEKQKADIERDVEKVKRKKKLEDDKEWAEKKMKWVLYEEQKASYLQSKQALTTAKQLKLQKEKALKKLETAQRKDDSNCKKWGEKVKESDKQLRASQRKLRQKQESVEEQLEEVNKIETELNSWHRNKEKHERNVQSTREEIARLTEELHHWQEKEREGSSEFGPEHQRRLDAIKLEIQNIHQDQLGCRQQLNKNKKLRDRIQINLDQIVKKLGNFTDATQQRFEALASMNSTKAQKVFRAYQWIEQNKGRFRGRVFGPIIKEVNIPNPEHTVFLENQVPKYVWESFVACHKEDRDMLQQELNDRYKMQVTVMFSPQGMAPITYPHGHASEYEALHITHTLDEVFEAPLVVKNAMKDTASINTAYVGTRYTQRQIEESGRRNARAQWRETKIQNLWTPDHRFMRSTSRYDGFETLRTTSVRPPRLLQHGYDNDNERQNLERTKEGAERELAECNHAITSFLERNGELDQRLDALDEEKDKLLKLKQQIIRKIKSISATLKSKKKQLEKLLKSVFTEEKENELLDQKKVAIKKQVSTIRSCAECYGKYTDIHFQSMPIHMEYEGVKQRMQALVSEIRIARSEMEHAVNRVDEIDAIYKRDREKLKIRKEEAELTCTLNDESKSKFASFPSDKEELEEFIIVVSAEINGMMVTDPNVLEEYKDLEKSITTLRSKVSGEEEEMENFEKVRQAIHKSWLEPLEETVAILNVKFGKLFEDLGFVGEVRLRKAGEDGENDYSKFALELWVKFRAQDELCILNSTTQSGGERSVSTIMFLLSLSSLSQSPFRVIDEINQGMDPTNERLVFKKLVEEATSASSSPQCFLLTPKLLPELHYDDSVNVLNIFNGPVVDLSQQFNFL